MEIHALTPDQGQAYRDYVASSPATNYCHDLGWMRVIAATYGKDPLYFLAREGGKVRGVASAFWLESWIFGRELVGMPYLDYGGVAADGAEAEAALLAELRRSAKLAGATLRLRQERPLAAAPAPANIKVRMVLDLAGRGEDAYWKALDAKVRNQVRKAEKSGIEVRWGGAECLDDFYRVFGVNMRDLGSPVHSKELFRRALVEFPGARIGLALWRGFAVGGMFRIAWRDTLCIPWASTLRAYRSYCPNNALYWEALRGAFRDGLRRVDFGRSTRDAGTYHFKRQWLAAEEPLPWYDFARGEALLNQVGKGTARAMETAAELWRRLPARATNWLGPQVRGLISA